MKGRVQSRLASRATQSGRGPARHVRAASRRGLAWQSRFVRSGLGRVRTAASGEAVEGWRCRVSHGWRCHAMQGSHGLFGSGWAGSGAARQSRCGPAGAVGGFSRGSQGQAPQGTARRGKARQSWPGSARVVWRVPAWKATQRSRGRPVWVRLLPARHGKARQSRRVPLVWSRRGRQRSQGPSRPGLAGLDRSWMVRQSRWSRQVQFGQRTFRQSWLVEVLRGEAS